MSSVRIIIVNFRTPELVVDCLRSLAGEVAGELDCRVVVVDNASGDGSVEFIRKAIDDAGWNAWTDVLPEHENRGFAAGNNAALRPLLAAPQPPDFVLLLNPDTWMRPGALRNLVEYLERRPDVGIVGSRLEYPDGTPLRVAAFRFHTVASEFEQGFRLGLISRLLHRRVVAPPVQSGPHRADWLSGASFLVRRAVFASVGLLDERYFLYFEEVDFCWRARAAGWSCWYVPASRVVHLKGQSSGVTSTSGPPRRVPRYWFDSRKRYFRKNHGRLLRSLRRRRLDAGVWHVAPAPAFATPTGPRSARPTVGFHPREFPVRLDPPQSAAMSSDQDALLQPERNQDQPLSQVVDAATDPGLGKENGTLDPLIADRSRATPAAQNGDELSRPKANADTGMKKTVVHGIAWIVFCSGLMIVLRFCSNLFLTWYLLSPRILGVMALVNLLVVGLQMFSDLGIRQCVIQNPRGDDPNFLRTAWTLQIMRGLFLWFCSALIAWPLAVFYREPALMWLIPTVGATAALDGFNSTSVFTLSRRLLRGRLVIFEVVPYVVSMSMVVGWVWWLAQQRRPGSDDNAILETWQLVALAAGTLCAGLCKMVVSYLLLPRFRHRFCFEKEARSRLLHFGGWVFVSTSCTFLAAQADRLVVGRISLNVLGVYHIANQLAAIPTMLMITLGSQMVFPLYSRALHAGQDVRAVYVRVHPLFTGFAAVLATGLFCTAPTVIGGLYNARYADAGRYLQLLTAVSWFTMLQNTRELLLLATGHTRALATGQSIRLLSLPPLLLGGFQIAGLTGMILGYALSEFIRYLVNVWLVREERRSALMNDIPLSLLIVGISVATSYIVPLLGEQVPRIVRFVFEGGFVVLAWVVVFVFWRDGRQKLLDALSGRRLAEKAES